MLGLLGTPGRGFDPRRVANLEAWYRAQDFVDLLGATDGTAITSWSDRSGNGRTLSQGTAANKPTLRTGVNGIGGMPAASFDGANDQMQSASGLGPFGPSTIIAVLQTGSDVVGNRCFFSGKTSIQYCFTGGSIFRANAGSGGSNGSTAIASKNYIVTTVTGAANGKIRVNGTETAANSGANTASQFVLGASDVNTLFWSGLISELLYFSRQLTAAEILYLEQGLQVEYGTFTFQNMTFFGTSYTTESTGSGSSSAATSTQALARKLVGPGPATNYAANGGVISQTGGNPTGISVDYGTAYWMMRNFAAPSAAPYAAPLSGLIVYDYGPNDLNLGGALSSGAAPLDTTFRDMVAGISILRATGQWEDNHATHNAAGSGWAQNSVTSRNAGSTDRGASSLPAGNILWTSPSDFPGGDILVRAIGIDGATRQGGQFDLFLTVSGGSPVANGSIDARGSTSTGARHVRTIGRVRDVPAGAGHVVTIDPTAISGAFIVYDGVTSHDRNGPVVAVFHMARLPAGGYAAHGGGVATYGDAEVNAFNALVDTIPSYFPAGTVVVVPLPDMHGQASYFNVDLIHPGDTGHAYRVAQLRRALRDAGYNVRCP